MDVVEFARDIMDLELMPYQEKMLRAIVRGRPVIFNNRRPGRKTLERVVDEYHQYKKVHAL